MQVNLKLLSVFVLISSNSARDSFEHLKHTQNTHMSHCILSLYLLFLQITQGELSSADVSVLAVEDILSLGGIFACALFNCKG